MAKKAASAPAHLADPFWAGVKQRKFMLQFDKRANRYQFFPRPLGVYGDRGTLEWREAKGTGKLIAVTTCHVPGPGFENEAPYPVGIVRLDEGPRVFARIINVTQQTIEPGQRMRIVWPEAGADAGLYAFAPVK